MITQENQNYRNEHGVVKELDYVNFENPLNNIVVPPVQHSKYASTAGTKKSGAGTLAKGFGKAAFGLLGAVSGGGWYGASMAGDGIGDMIRGAGNHQITSDIILQVTSSILKEENSCWGCYNFLKTFVPAQGNIGDIVFKDGACDNFHTGNGHRFFENGDYFEGYFENGTIKRGLYIWANGQRYLGEFDETLHMTGYGITIYPNGAYYAGQYIAGAKNGWGFQIYTDGAYSGEWQNEVRTYGALRLENGQCFLGEFVNDQPVM